MVSAVMRRTDVGISLLTLHSKLSKTKAVDSNQHSPASADFECPGILEDNKRARSFFPIESKDNGGGDDDDDQYIVVKSEDNDNDGNSDYYLTTTALRQNPDNSTAATKLLRQIKTV
jgi:hypothetical protein